MKITWKEFAEKYLTELQSKAKSADDLKSLIVKKLEELKVVATDDDGNEVDIETIEVKAQEKETVKTEDIADVVRKTIKAEFATKGVSGASRIYQTPDTKEFKLPATSCKFGNLAHFKGQKADEKAYRFGRWFLAARGHKTSLQFCKDYGIPVVRMDGNDNIMTKGQTEGTNTAGGFLVPPEFDTDLIDLRLQYGVFRRNARTVPMMSDTKHRMRRTGGLTAYFVGEAVAGTESTKAWDQITLVAKKIATLTLYSNEINEDALINVGDDLAGEIAYAFAYKEDLCGFLGDGTSTYGGIVGLTQKMANVAAGVTETGGQILASGNLFSEFTLGDFNRMVGKLPTYARMGAKWYASPVVYSSVMERLAYAAGGATTTEIVNGIAVPKFMGYPVELTEVLPTSDSNSQRTVFFGDLRLAADFGSKRETTISVSDSATVGSVNVFETDQLAIRGTERFDINVHDMGTSSVAGPVVCLISAAS